MSDALSHELVHRYDDCCGTLPGLTNLASKEACCGLLRSEVRAAALSGDCKFSREFFRGNLFPVARHHQVRQSPHQFTHLPPADQICARRRALLSVRSAVECAGLPVEQILDETFEKAFADTEPFEEIP